MRPCVLPVLVIGVEEQGRTGFDAETGEITAVGKGCAPDNLVPLASIREANIPTIGLPEGDEEHRGMQHAAYLIVDGVVDSLQVKSG